ncbi:MAG: 3-keto-5-aminohexanoate cleavage protein [Planctomycetes bacterium]|nr:3-keto-5-aminohexanoate cleavage protein [Planctomycetota bacterium]
MPPRPVIVTCAITGSVHTPSMSPHLPVSAERIASEAIAAAEAGASILHLHARDPLDGRPSPDPDAFFAFLPEIKRATDAVINITTGGGQNMTVTDRLQAALRAKPEMCSLNMGSMNFGLYPMLEKPREWKHDWEQGYLSGSKDFIFKNTFADIERILKELGEGCGTKFEFECYDTGHLYNLAHFLDRKLVRPPIFIQTIFGILGGIGPDMECLNFMAQTAARLFGNAFHWSVLGAGRHQMPLATAGALRGSHVRVGLEDSLYLGPGELARSNADQVRKIHGILNSLSLEIARPEEARRMLELKGKNQVAF